MKDFLKLRAPLSGLLCCITMRDNDDGGGSGGGGDDKKYMTPEQFNAAAKSRETKLLKLFEDKLAASNTTLTEQVTASIAEAFKTAGAAGDKGKDTGKGKDDGVSPEVEARLKAAEDRATAAEDRSKKLEDDRQSEKTKGLRQGERTALQAALVKANVIPDMLGAAMAVHTSKLAVRKDGDDKILWSTGDELDPTTSLEKGLAAWAKTPEAQHFIGTGSDSRGSGGRRAASGATGGKRKDGKATAEDVGEFLEDFI